ncbi:MAG: low molecular weight protein arginine phosphatase [Gemmatimonadales bacterium]
MSEHQRMRVLIVCTGNTCRSPIAEGLLRRAVEAAGRGDIEVGSAGTGAWEGAPASEGSYLVSLEQGIDLSGHRARMITPELIGQADLVLTMSRGHLGRVRELGGGGRAHLLAEYAAEGAADDIFDPFGGDLDDYRATFRALEPLIARVAERILEGGR